MESATESRLLIKKKQKLSNKQLTEKILKDTKNVELSIRNLHKIYCEKNPRAIIPFSTFYYKLMRYSLTEVEYNRVNIALKSFIESYQKI